MNQLLKTDRTGVSGAVEKIVTAWALLGGVLLLAIIVMNVVSVIGGVVWVPFPGDFELTQIGIAIVAFSFLPYTQLTGNNVTADIFTAKAGPRTVAFLSGLAGLVAMVFAELTLKQMYLGLQDQKTYNYTTAILLFPIWTAFVPILMSLGLLIVASVVSFLEGAKRVAGS